MQRIYKEKNEDTDIVTEFCKILSYSYLKLCVYRSIIHTLESFGVRYRIKENEVAKNKTIYTIISEPKKIKIVELVIIGTEIFCSAYNQLCIANFIPLVPLTRIYLREVSEIIKSTIEIQQEYLKL